MSMVVRTNINSMNANRNLSINNSQVAKAIEKLASGYAINRAADDASGLAITEKMQAQITGLDQGTDNALEGIGLVQTAEGAMSEIHDMLNRIVELATKSANGTIQDEVDREAVQAEVDVLVDEIDRIAQSTNYNGIDLLNGNLSDGGLVIKTMVTETITNENAPQVNTDLEISGVDESKVVNIGGFTITGGDLDVDFSYDAINDKLIVLTDTKIIISGTGDAIEVDDSAESADIVLQNANIVSSSTSAFSTGDNDVTITLVGSNTLTGYAGTDGADSWSLDGYAGLNVGANGSITLTGNGELSANGGSGSSGIGGDRWGTIGSITILSGDINASGGTQAPGIGAGGIGTQNGDIIITGGTITASGGDYGSGIGTGQQGKLYGNITITGGIVDATGGSGAAGIGAGFGIYSIIYGNISISGGDITSKGGQDAAGIGTGFSSTLDGKILITSSNVTAIPGNELYGVSDSIGNGYSGIINDNYYIDTDLSDLPSTDLSDLPSTDLGDLPPTTTVTRTETEVYNGDGLILHVADQNETYNKIRVYIDPMTGEALKIKPLYVYTQELAGAAINIVKDAINYVSTNRCNVGALQNRLEHTINGNNSTSENMTASKSAIKDADMAKEMMEYTKMNVLTQASQAMLAQSNQSTQQILSLLG